MLMIFVDEAEGALTTRQVQDGTTVNKEYYKSYLRKILLPTIGCKRPELLRVTPLILHDNPQATQCCYRKGRIRELPLGISKTPVLQS